MLSKKRPKTAANGPAHKHMVMSSSLSSLVASCSQGSPSSPVPQRPRFSTAANTPVGGVMNGANVSFPSSVGDDRRRPKPAVSRLGRKKKLATRPTRAHVVGDGATPPLTAAQPATTVESASAPSNTARTKNKKTVTAMHARQSDSAHPPKRQAATPVAAKVTKAANTRTVGPVVSGPSSSRSSSSKVVSTMKPPKQRRRRHRAERSRPTKSKPQPSAVEATTPARAAVVVAAAVTVTAVVPCASSEPSSSLLVSPVVHARSLVRSAGASPSSLTRDVPRFQEYPMEMLISSRYEDAVRTSVVARGSRSNSEQQSPGSATTGAVPLAAATASDSGGIAQVFPSRPDFRLDASVSAPVALTMAKSDTLSSSEFLLSPLVAVQAGHKEGGVPPAAAGGCAMPATAGLSFTPSLPAAADAQSVIPPHPQPQRQPPQPQTGSMDAMPASPAAMLEMLSFPTMRSLADGLEDSGHPLTAEDRQLSSVGLRVAATAFQPRFSADASCAGLFVGTPSALLPASVRATSVASLPPHRGGQATTPASTVAARNVLTVVNTATGATQPHSPASGYDFPRAPAGGSSGGATRPLALATTPGSVGSPLSDAVGDSVTMSPAAMPSPALVRRDLSLSNSTGDEPSFGASSFPALPPPRLSRSGSRRVSPLVAPAPFALTQDVRHQHVTIASLVSAENEILSQLFDAPDEDDEDNQADSYSPGGLPDEDEDEVLVQGSWEVGSASSVGRGPRRSYGQAYWHLDHESGAGLVAEGEFPEDVFARRSGGGAAGRDSVSYTAGAGYWPHEDYDASVADPDEYEDIWEVNSSAYEDSLDEAQVQWIEEQLRANENPEGFFF